MMKRVFPIFWFGFIALCVLINVASGMLTKAPIFLLVPIIMAGFGYVLMKKLVWDLMDEVYDCGDHLLIRNRGEETSVRLADVVNVSATTMVNPPRITLRVAGAETGKLGGDIAFSPSRPLFYNPFRLNPIAEDLMMRADEARQSRYRSAL